MIEDTDSELTFKVKEKKDEKALIELINRHSGIYIHMVNKYGGKAISPLQYEDLIKDKDYQIYKAAIDYDESKSKFCTHLANRAKYLCLTNRSENKENSNIVNFSDQEMFIEDPKDHPDGACEKEEILKKLMTIIKEISDERTRDVFLERYFSNQNGKVKPWKEIAKKFNLSIQGAINIHDREIPKLLKKLKNEQITF